MEGIDQIKLPEDIEQKALWYYNMAQVCVAIYQKLKGLIQFDHEYVDGSAELFHMMANRIVTMTSDFDWKKIREESEQIRRPTNQQIMEVLNNKKSA